MQLVIESATGTCSAALLDEQDQLLDDRHELVGRGHAERLVPMIAELLAGRQPSAIFVDCGPGSFTGVRVGLAAAHGMAIGWGADLFGFSSLALLAARSGYDEVAVALQGGHGELFVQTYAGDPLMALDELRSLSPAAAASHIRSERVIGSGSQALVEARGTGSWSDADLRAADLRLLPRGLRRLPASPIYGRAPDAKPMP